MLRGFPVVSFNLTSCWVGLGWVGLGCIYLNHDDVSFLALNGCTRDGEGVLKERQTDPVRLRRRRECVDTATGSSPSPPQSQTEREKYC
ncbi:hypothetical protein L484_017229 [Morus notabilis]|uniref:Uncharacterized protein n=1 Tax=Morus notabilis TaxID=981085 RepID=W9R625_9ROSA|nr:hypothetical protein L484_017229 [Morus notabilis]